MSNNIPGNVESIDCDLICKYTMFYVNDKYTIANTGSNLILTPTITGSKNITYADENYTLNNIIIISSPQAHSFTGSVIGEVIINHILLNGPKELNVCIPIQIGSSNSIINDIIQAAHGNYTVPSTTSSQFTIMDIIPHNTFYNYTSVNNKKNIVFDSTNAITITQETYNMLLSMLTAESSINKDDYLYNELFKSLNPPINGILEKNDIVIDCTAINDGSYEDELIHKRHADSSGSLMSPETISGLLAFLTAIIIISLLVFVAWFFVNGGNKINQLTNMVKVTTAATVTGASN